MKSADKAVKSVKDNSVRYRAVLEARPVPFSFLRPGLFADVDADGHRLSLSRVHS